jgi:hypothetical protein
VRCHTRYCDSNCQHDHWRRGHKQICKKIHRGGNAEQYNADKKYKEAVAAAVERCAADTEGKTCYICMEGAKRRHAPDEGLVRGCACRGTSGFAHVSCLAEQAKIVVEDAVGSKRYGSGAQSGLSGRVSGFFRSRRRMVGAGLESWADMTLAAKFARHVNDKSVTQSSVESGLLHNGWLPVNILPIAQEWSENWVDRTKADAFVSEAKRTSHEAAARLKRLTEEMLERNASIMPSLRIS